MLPAAPAGSPAAASQQPASRPTDSPSSKTTAASGAPTQLGRVAGEQPWTGRPQGEATSAGNMITSDLVPFVLKHLRGNDPSGVRTFRQLCKKARDATDGEAVTALRVRGGDVATQLRLARGMLARGTCRRLRELELTGSESEEEAVFGAAEHLFGFVSQNPSPNRPAVTKLTVSLRLLTPEAARAAEAALPGLEELVVLCDGVDGLVDAPIDWRALVALDLTAALELLERQVAALGLAVLLGPSPAPRAGIVEEAGVGASASGERRPLLPALRQLELNPNLDTLPLAVAAALQAATQLRSLRLHLDLSHSSAATSLGRLSGMTQLDTLELASRNAHRPARQRFAPQTVASFGAALAPLGGTLRSLAIRFDCCDVILAQCFTTLRSLQELRLGDAWVSASSLSGLTSLTRLHAGFVGLTAAEAEAGSRFRLPPQLRALRLVRVHNVVQLAGLEPLPSLTEVAVGAGQAPSDRGLVRLCLARPTSVDAASRLTPAGEEALCRAAAFLPGTRVMELDGAGREGGGPVPLLLPPLEPAPGFEGHGRWLSAWGASKLGALMLVGVALSAADLATIARCMPGLEGMTLHHCSFPVEAVWVLAALPRLTKLVCTWPAGVEVPQGTEAALEDLLARTGPRLTVKFLQS